MFTPGHGQQAYAAKGSKVRLSSVWQCMHTCPSGVEASVRWLCSYSQVHEGWLKKKQKGFMKSDKDRCSGLGLDRLGWAGLGLMGWDGTG